MKTALVSAYIFYVCTCFVFGVKNVFFVNFYFRLLRQILTDFAQIWCADTCGGIFSDLYKRSGCGPPFRVFGAKITFFTNFGKYFLTFLLRGLETRNLYLSDRLEVLYHVHHAKVLNWPPSLSFGAKITFFTNFGKYFLTFLLRGLETRNLYLSDRLEVLCHVHNTKVLNWPPWLSFGAKTTFFIIFYYLIIKNL